MDNVDLNQRVNEDDAEICSDCGNVFRVAWLKQGDDYNDFGYRYCPFCGKMTDEYAHLGKNSKEKTNAHQLR